MGQGMLRVLVVAALAPTLMALSSTLTSTLSETWLPTIGPVVDQSPANTTVDEFSELVLRCTVLRATSFEWYKLADDANPTLRSSWHQVAGESSDQFVRNPVLGTDAGVYRLSVSGPFGYADSPPIQVDVIPSSEGLAIISQPLSVIELNAGSDTVLQVTARSTSDLQYQWYEDGMPLVDKTESSMLITSLAEAGSYRYKCQVCVQGGSPCLNTSITTIYSLNEFREPWPLEHHQASESKLILIKGTRPYPERDDDDVRCLFQLRESGVLVSFDSPFHIDRRAFILYDEQDVPTVYCELGPVSKPGVYDIMVSVQSRPSLVQSNSGITVYDALDASFVDTTVTCDAAHTHFNFSVAGKFKYFPIDRQVFGFLDESPNVLPTSVRVSRPSMVACTVISEDRLNCNAERATFSSSVLSLAMNGISLNQFGTLSVAYNPTLLRSNVLTQFRSTDTFRYMSPSNGPMRGGFEVEVSGYSFSYAGQEIVCTFESSHNDYSIKVGGEVSSDGIVCRAPAWAYPGTVSLFVDIGETKRVLVVPPLEYFDVRVDRAYPQFLPHTVNDMYLPSVLNQQPDLNLFETLLQPFSNSLFGLKANQELFVKMTTFFVRGSGFPRGVPLDARLCAGEYSSSQDLADVDCAVTSTNRIMCRLSASPPDVGMLNLHLSFNHFVTWLSTPLNVFDMRTLYNMQPQPEATSLQDKDNIIVLTSSEASHYLVDLTQHTSHVHLHIPQLSHKAMNCVVSGSQSIVCHIPRPAPSMRSQPLQLFLSVSGSSTRYRVKTPLKFFQAPQVVSLEPPIWSGYGNQKAAVTFYEPVPDDVQLGVMLRGDSTDARFLACADVHKGFTGDLGLEEDKRPNKVVFTIPPVPYNWRQAHVMLSVNGIDVDIGRRGNDQALIYNTVVDKVWPTSVDVRAGTVITLAGLNINPMLVNHTYIRLHGVDEFRDLMADSSTVNSSHISFNVPELPRMLPMLGNTTKRIPLSVSFDDRVTFWTIQHSLTLFSCNMSSLDMQHVLGNGGSSLLILSGPCIPGRSEDQPVVRLTPFDGHVVQPHDTAFGVKTFTGKYSDASTMVVRLPAFSINHSLEIAFDGQTFHRLPLKYLKSTIVASGSSAVDPSS